MSMLEQKPPLRNHDRKKQNLYNLAQTGNEEALYNLIEIHGHEIKSMLRKDFNNALVTQDIEDIIQDTCLEACSIIKRQKQKQRQQQRGLRSNEFSTQLYNCAVKAAEQKIADKAKLKGNINHIREKDPFDVCTDSEREETKNAALESLTKEHQQVLKLRINGLQYDEIAYELRISEGTVKSRIHSAKNHLRKTLKALETASETPEIEIHLSITQ